ncbi:MAG: hypothetical protein AABY92_05195, partial [Thermodesulfobacteriota bacterium]
METIHFKTVDPVSQDLLRGASQKGLGLNWERYEKQQPQDGFLRLGLSCPYGCMQGPCRIDPYGRGADRGICGLDRDGMAAAFLLRLVFQGVLETMHEYPTVHHNAEIAWQAPLDKNAAAALAQAGGTPLCTSEILETASLLSRPYAPPEALVRLAVRLGLLGIGLAEQCQPEKHFPSMGCRVGYGLLAGEATLIGMTGRIPEVEVQALLKEAAGLKNPEVHLISLGDWIPAGENFLPISSTSGEAETVFSSGKLNLLVAGPQADPGLLALCGQMKVPVLFSGDKTGATEVLRLARNAYDHRVPVSFNPEPGLVGEGRVSIGAADVEAALKNGASAKIALIGSGMIGGTLAH